MPESKTATVGDVLGSSGAPLCLTYLGKSHPVSPPTLRVLDRVEKFVAKRAAESLAELASVLSPAELQRQQKSLDTAIRAREYATGGELWAAEFRSDGGNRGMLIMLWCCLEEARESTKRPTELPPPIPFDDMPTVLQESPDAGTVMAMVLPDFSRAVGKRRRLPAAMMDTLENHLKELPDQSA